jgi:uncharacterized membrane protein (DUF373 family)
VTTIMEEKVEIFTTVSLFSLGAVVGVLVVAYVLASTLLPRGSGLKDRVTFVWLVREKQKNASVPATADL